MDTRISWINLKNITHTNTTAGIYILHLNLNTSRAGELAEDSYLTITISSPSTTDAVYKINAPAYNEIGVINTSVVITGLSIPNQGDDNSLTGFTLSYDDGLGLPTLWNNLNTVYQGSMTEYLKITYTPV
jgi:hypothetical protein